MDFIELMSLIDLMDFIDLAEIQRAELLKQECHTGQVVSNIHSLGPKNTQKVADELKNYTHRGRRFALPPVCIVFHFIGNFLCIFGPSLYMLLTTFPVRHSCFNNSALCSMYCSFKWISLERNTLDTKNAGAS